MTASVPSILAVSARPAVAFAALGVVWGAYSSQIPDIKSAIGASDSQFGIATGCAALGLVLALAFTARLDRILGRYAMPVGTLALACAVLLPGLAGGLIPFALALFVMNLSSCALDIVMNARVAELEAKHARALMNFNHGVFSLAYAVSALTVGFLRGLEVAPPVIFALAAAVLLALAAFTILEPAQVSGQGGRVPALWPLVIPGGAITLLAFMTEGGTEIWSALHIERTLGGSVLEGSTGPALLGLTMALGRFGGQAATRVIRESRLLVVACLVASAGALIAALAPSPGVAYAGFGILGLGVSVIAPTALAMVGRRATDAARTSVIARTAVIGYSGFFLGPPLMGALSEAVSLRASFIGLGLACLLILPALAALMRQPKQD